MAQIKEFVVNDRRKFTAEGQPRPDAPPSEPKAPRPEASLEPTSDERLGSSAHLVETPRSQNGPQAVPQPGPHAVEAAHEPNPDANQADQAPQPPTAEQAHQAAVAYTATVERLDTAIRASNPGMERIPEMSFAGLVQRLYIEALMQLGGVTQADQQPRVDLLGARQTIDMLAVLADKTADNLTGDEDMLLRSALFELRMGFLELTQALARQAQQNQQANPTGAPFSAPTGGGPSLIR